MDTIREALVAARSYNDMPQMATSPAPKVLLIYTQRAIWTRTFESIGNLGIQTLADQLNAKGFDASTFVGISVQAVKTIQEQASELFAVGFYCDYDNQTLIQAICRKLKADRSFYIIIGGPQTLHMTEKALDDFSADAIICGEADDSLGQWLLGKLSHTPVNLPEVIDRLHARCAEYRIFDRIPEVLSKHCPHEAQSHSPLVSVITARGCPYRCAFCYEGGVSKKLRNREISHVLLEVEKKLAKSKRPSYVFFADDTLTTSVTRLHELLDGLKKLRQRYDFVWFCEGHAGFLHRHLDLIPEMIDAGLVRMQIGMESGNDHILSAYNKRIDTNAILSVLQKAYDCALQQIAGNFIVGGAFETKETLERTNDFVLHMLKSFPGFIDFSTTFIMPLPGTRIKQHPSDFDLILEDPEYITSIEDFPVNRTRELSLTDICSARLDIVTNVSTEMTHQFAAGEIDKRRIKKDYELAIKYGIVSSYLKFVYAKNPMMHLYYPKLIMERLYEWEDIVSFERYYSVLTVSLKSIPIEEFSDLEIAILRLSGSAPLGEMMNALTCDSDTFIRTMKSLSDKYLLLYKLIPVERDAYR